jgi:drug/metabolite transporter (DMT)-like permease
MKTYAAAVLTTVVLSFAQVLFKLLAVKGAAAGLSLTNWKREALDFLWLGGGAVLVWVVAAGFWLYVLKSLPLHRAYAFAALTFVFVPFFSYLILHETVTTGTVAGSALIIVGILVAANY